VELVYANIPRIVRLLIVDDHPIIRDGIRLMMGTPNRDFKFLVEDARSGEEAISMCLHNRYDMVLMDYQLKALSGADTTKKIMSYDPQAKILVFSNYNYLDYVNASIEAGAKGYIIKSIEGTELIKAIGEVLAGGEYFSNEVHIKMREAKNRKTITTHSLKHGITQKEQEIIQLLSAGLTTKEIGKKLFVSARTVEGHRQNLMTKLNVKNVAELIGKAHSLKLISSDSNSL
jgi:DNA-binding NarL/FixJ family response regulator